MLQHIHNHTHKSSLKLLNSFLVTWIKNTHSVCANCVCISLVLVVVHVCKHAWVYMCAETPNWLLTWPAEMYISVLTSTQNKTIASIIDSLLYQLLALHMQLSYKWTALYFLYCIQPNLNYILILATNWHQPVSTRHNTMSSKEKFL